MKKKVIASIVLVVALAGGVFTVSQMEKIPTGRVGVQYSLNGGVKDEVFTICTSYYPCKRVYNWK